MTRRLAAAWRNLRDRARFERELDDEVRAAFDQLVDENMRAGMSDAAARRAAAIALGGLESVKAQAREERAGALLDAWAQDLRYATRLLRRNPLFTITAVLSLAIGIGATTAIFTVANGLLLRRPAGVREPDRLIDISHTESGSGLAAVATNPLSSYSTFRDLRARAATLSDVFAYQLDLSAWSLARDGGAERVFGNIVSPNYFTALGVRPAAGRLFAESDGRDAPIVVLSHAFWTRRFDRDPGLVGQTIRVNGHPFTVIGVAAEGFRGVSVLAADMWAAVTALPLLQRDAPRTLDGLQVMIGARLAAGVTRAQAAAEVEYLGRQLAGSRSRMRDLNGVQVAAGVSGLAAAASSPVPGNIRLIVAAFVTLLMALVSLVLVIACANLTGVLLARASTRRREIAVRLAVGVGRARLVRQLLTETLLLFALGCATGLLMARALTTLVLALLPSFPQSLAVTFAFDWRVVAFGAGLSLVAAVLSGLVPALHASKADVIAALKDDSQAPPERLRLRNVFVAAQIAFSLVLVIAAGVFLGRLGQVAAVGGDLSPADIDVVSLDLTLAGYEAEQGRQFVRDLGERLRALPSIAAFAVADRAPDPNRMMAMAGGLTVPGRDPDAGRSVAVNWNVVSPGYFAALRLPLVAGRDFNADDRAASQAVAVVSESTARRLWPGADAVGRTLHWTPFRFDVTGVPSTLLVVGVVKDLYRRDRQFSPAPPLVLYVPVDQRYAPSATILARRARAASAAGDITAVIRSMDPNLPVLSSRTLEEELTGPEDVQLRIAASVSGTVGFIGLLLAGIGIYGVTAYSVARRTREIGVRVALGADRFAVITMVLRQGMALVGAGCLIGVVLAAAASRLMATTFFGIPPLETATFGGAVGLFALIGLAACYMPARRAIRINAMEALRYE